MKNHMDSKKSNKIGLICVQFIVFNVPQKLDIKLLGDTSNSLFSFIEYQ